MKNKRIVLLMAVLAALTAVLAVIHFAARDQAPAGTIKIEASAGTINLALSGLELTEVKGTVVNGKGEESIIDAQGILLSELLAELPISELQEVTAEADDSYSASVSAEEIAAPETVYLIVQEDGGIQLIVFGDPNSRRLVSDVVCLRIR